MEVVVGTTRKMAYFHIINITQPFEISFMFMKRFSSLVPSSRNDFQFEISKLRQTLLCEIRLGAFSRLLCLNCIFRRGVAVSQNEPAVQYL